MAFGASEAARWQAYQTRARMGAHLWFQIITIAVLSWIVLTLYVVWRQTGLFYPQLDHQYFWYWVFCGIIIDTPLLNLCAPNLKVPAPGGWYPLPQFTACSTGRSFTTFRLRPGSFTTECAPHSCRSGSDRWRSSGSHAITSMLSTSADSDCWRRENITASWAAVGWPASAAAGGASGSVRASFRKRRSASISS
jgi:hypothetical protein